MARLHGLVAASQEEVDELAEVPEFGCAYPVKYAGLPDFVLQVDQPRIE
jgi:hypothetical protein